MTITTDILRKIAPTRSAIDFSAYADFITLYASEFGITSKLRMAHFLAQVTHESGEFRYTEENLNYSAERLLKVFPKYFNQKRAQQYAHKPFAIGARVYANRMGNGEEATLDGFTYRGRGLIQLTGRDNYRAFNDYLHSLGSVDIDVVKNPDEVAKPELAVCSAMWFWSSRGLNRLADSDDLKLITRKINGGTNGLAQRQLYLLRAKTAL